MKPLEPWLRYTLFGVAGLAVLYAVYFAFVTIDNGTDVDVYVEVGNHKDGASNHGGHAMYLVCTTPAAVAPYTPSACPSGSSTITVHKRDRVHLHVTNADGGGRTHDIRLLGGPYFLWPAGFEDELESGHADLSFTAYKSGTFDIVCELAGHEAAGMRGTLVVQ